MAIVVAVIVLGGGMVVFFLAVVIVIHDANFGIFAMGLTAHIILCDDLGLAFFDRVGLILGDFLGCFGGLVLNDVLVHADIFTRGIRAFG